MVVPVSRAGFSRVTHPFATVPRSKLRVLVRLACIRHAASVRPEPGSNSPSRSWSPRRASTIGVLVCQTPEGVRVADGAYVETGHRWLQQPALPADVTQRFVAGNADDWLADPVEGRHFELTEDCSESRNSKHPPHSLLRPSLPFSRCSQHRASEHLLRGTMCRARCPLCGLEVPVAPRSAAYRPPHGANCYATGAPREVQPWIARFLRNSGEFVGCSGGNVSGGHRQHQRLLAVSSRELRHTPTAARLRA